MTDPIAAKAEALWAKRPELRPLGLKCVISPASKEIDWWLDDYSLCDEDAHLLIEAECWRALPQAMWFKMGDIVTIRRTTNWSDLGIGATLTEALIAACMEAGQ